MVKNATGRKHSVYFCERGLSRAATLESPRSRCSRQTRPPQVSLRFSRVLRRAPTKLLSQEATPTRQTRPTSDRDAEGARQRAPEKRHTPSQPLPSPGQFSSSAAHVPVELLRDRTGGCPWPAVPTARGSREPLHCDVDMSHARHPRRFLGVPGDLRAIVASLGLFRGGSAVAHAVHCNLRRGMGACGRNAGDDPRAWGVLLGPSASCHPASTRCPLTPRRATAHNYRMTRANSPARDGTSGDAQLL